MAGRSSLQIIGLGAATSIGRNVWASAAAARAGLCGFREHPFMIDTAGEPMRVARAPWLDVEVRGVDRFRQLLLPVIDEALEPVCGHVQRRTIRLGLALALPPFRPGQPGQLAGDLHDAIAQQYPGLFSRISEFEVGHAAGHLCLDAALMESRAERIDACLVAGVDSYLAPETLEWVEECDQLHGGGPLNNAWGFIPGEAAGAVLLAAAGHAQRIGLTALGEVVSVGLGHETKLIKTDAVCIGEGLTQAFRNALGALTIDERVHNVFCDLNGEKYRADEYGFAALRTKDRFRSVSDFIAPGDCWGDVGAAGVFLHTALAIICHRKRYGKGPLSLVCASSEAGERGAIIIGALHDRAD
jgi:3-oxoacyl-[acyl-carrier-protein] synthase-1